MWLHICSSYTLVRDVHRRPSSQYASKTCVWRAFKQRAKTNSQSWTLSKLSSQSTQDEDSSRHPSKTLLILHLKRLNSCWDTYTLTHIHVSLKPLAPLLYGGEGVVNHTPSKTRLLQYCILGYTPLRKDSPSYMLFWNWSHRYSKKVTQTVLIPVIPTHAHHTPEYILIED